MQLINLFLFWLFFGLLVSHFAKKRGRHPLGWFMIGLFLGGFFGLLLLFLLPKVKKTPVTTKPLQPAVPRKSESWLKMWYILDPSHMQQGPFEFSDLIKKWREKALTETSYVWGEGMKEWKKLAELPELLKEMEH